MQHMKQRSKTCTPRFFKKEALIESCLHTIFVRKEVSKSYILLLKFIEKIYLHQNFWFIWLEMSFVINEDKRCIQNAGSLLPA